MGKPTDTKQLYVFFSWGFYMLKHMSYLSCLSSSVKESTKGHKSKTRQTQRNRIFVCLGFSAAVRLIRSTPPIFKVRPLPLAPDSGSHSKW